MTSRAFPRAVLLLVVGTAAVAGLVATGPEAASAACPWMDAAHRPARRADQLLRAMSLDDKIRMVTGIGRRRRSLVNRGATGEIAPNRALCIPALVLNDGGAGLGNRQAGTTAFPDGVTQAATWNTSLLGTYGAALGQEAFTKGVNDLLAPGVDIARNPLGGRNFEYAGEDPYLASQVVAALVAGIQSRHVVATVKHYAANDQETQRHTDSSDVDERTLEEIHLPAFAAAVKAGVGSVMCAFNRVNSVYACENHDLLRTRLDRQFGFNGWVVSDWGATHSTVASARAGLDMEMPSPVYYGAALRSAVRSGQVRMAVLDEMARRILLPMFRLGLFDHVPAEGAAAAAADASTPRHLRVARRVAEQGAVLLKNDAGVLPITARGSSIAVIGTAAGKEGAEMAAQGWGSSHVPGPHVQTATVAPLQAITARAQQDGDHVTYVDSTDTAAASAAAAAADTAVVFINDVEVEGKDRPDLDAHSGTCSRTCALDSIDQNALVSAVARANDRTIVVVQSGGPVAMPWLSQVKGVVEAWYPGQVDGDALAPLLFGDVNFAGKLPVTFPVNLADDPLQSPSQYPGVVVTGDTVGPHSSYSEHLLVGYRWYDARQIVPLFPFGYGLSYTTFQFSGLHITPTTTGATVTAVVTNTGTRSGVEVAQLYVADPPAAGEPPHQLEGFQRVALAPGQSTSVTFRLGTRSFSVWSSAEHAWRVTPGTYGILVGDSSRSLPLQGSLSW